MNGNVDMPETQEIVESPVEDEQHRIVKARERLARREVELRQIIRHYNGEMDIVRRKLCKDLQVMEVIREEIDKAGTGPLREQLEEDFHNGTHILAFMTNCRIPDICGNVDKAKGKGRGFART